MARLTEYNLDMAKEVCQLVQDGMNVKAALKTNDAFPSFPTWCKWKRENSELLNLYVNAIQDKAEGVDCSIDETIEELRDGKIEPSAANVIIQTYKWKASKYYPKMFGDKQEIDHKNSDGSLKPIQLTPEAAKSIDKKLDESI